MTLRTPPREPDAREPLMTVRQMIVVAAVLDFLGTLLFVACPNIGG